MKKGLFALASIAFIFASVHSYAKAPVISGIPDVVITHKPDQYDALTAGDNWFRYINAFNILRYVEDEDSDTSDLEFSFDEASSDNDITINTDYQLGAGDVLDPPDSADPTQGADGSYWFTFQDMVRCPNFTGPFGTPDLGADGDMYLPFHDQFGGWLDDGPRAVTLWVADEADNLTSKTFAVWSVYDTECNITDGLSGTILTTFPVDLTNWVWTATFPGVTAATPSTAGVEPLQITSTVSSGDPYFGRWHTPKYLGWEGSIPVFDLPGEDWIYACVYSVSHDQTQTNTVPAIRFGAVMAFDHVTIFNSIGTYAGTGDADENPQWGAAGETVDYMFCWDPQDDKPNFSAMENLDAGVGEPVDVNTWVLFFDLLNVNATDQGTLTLSKVDVHGIVKPDDLAGGDPNRVDYADPQFSATPTAGSFSNYQTYQAGTVSVVDNGTEGFRFSVGSNAGTADTYYCTDAPDKLTWTADKMIRITAGISAVNARDFHAARIRAKTTNAHWYHTFVIQASAIVDAITPGTDVEAYSTYLSSYGGPSALLQGVSWDEIEWGIDYLSQHHEAVPGPIAAADMNIEYVSTEVLDEPNLD